MFPSAHKIVTELNQYYFINSLVANPMTKKNGSKFLFKLLFGAFCQGILCQNVKEIINHKIIEKEMDLYEIIFLIFDVLLTVHLSIFISVISQLDAQNCFTISLFHASTCFEHMCSSSGGQNYITQPLVSSHL